APLRLPDGGGPDPGRPDGRGERPARRRHGAHRRPGRAHRSRPVPARADRRLARELRGDGHRGPLPGGPAPVIGEGILVVGAALAFHAAAGPVRFRDLFARIHALTKASALGLALILLGAAASLENANDITSLVLVAMLHVVTSPIGSNLLTRATYCSEG